MHQIISSGSYKSYMPNAAKIFASYASQYVARSDAEFIAVSGTLDTRVQDVGSWSVLARHIGGSVNVHDSSKFSALVAQWRKERGIASSTTKIVTCPSYQKIIGMGEKAVPLILRQLRAEGDDPDHWFWALEMITGEDPIPVEAYGDTTKMAEAWLLWAQGSYA